jgi:hypothetical protein
VDIDSLTIKEIKHIQSLLRGPGDQRSRWILNKNYFIRTVTHHLVGTLIEVTPKELWLKDVSWIADDGRFMQALRGGNLNEVEPFPDGFEVPVGRGALIDACIWIHPLPREQK